MLWWLVTGNLYDNDRFGRLHVCPVVTVLVVVGIGVCIARWRTFARRPRPRRHLGGHAGHVVRAHHVRVPLQDRAGQQRHLHPPLPNGRAAVGHPAGRHRPRLPRAARRRRACCACFPEERRGWATQPAGRGIVAGLCIVGAGRWCSPRPGATWTPTTAHNATNIGLQAEADTQQGPQIDRLLAYVRAHPRGRVYAGSPTNWGEDFTVGAVPGVQVPGEQGHRRGRLHAAHGVAHDRPRVLLRRAQPGRLPALRHRLHHHSRRHGVAGGGRQGRLLGRLLPVGAAPTRATSTSTTPPASSRPPGPTSGSQSTTLLASPLLDEQRDLTVAFNGQAAAAADRGRPVGAAGIARAVS